MEAQNNGKESRANKREGENVGGESENKAQEKRVAITREGDNNSIVHFDMGQAIIWNEWEKKKESYLEDRKKAEELEKELNRHLLQHLRAEQAEQAEQISDEMLALKIQRELFEVDESNVLTDAPNLTLDQENERILNGQRFVLDVQDLRREGVNVVFETVEEEEGEECSPSSQHIEASSLLEDQKRLLETLRQMFPQVRESTLVRVIIKYDSNLEKVALYFAKKLSRPQQPKSSSRPKKSLKKKKSAKKPAKRTPNKSISKKAPSENNNEL